MKTNRKAEYPIEEYILHRWSPRAMTGEPISDHELMSLFEAARWAPSSFNGQPWRFIYAKRNNHGWDKLFKLLVPFNQGWAKNAAVLILVISKNTFEYNNNPSKTHSFDTGLACENMMLQACAQGLVIHGMEGFDYEKAKTELNIPEGYTVEAMFAVGKPGKKEDLSPELQEREVPSDRKPISEFAFEGTFKPKGS